MAFDLLAEANAAAEYEDQTQVKSGGDFEYKPPAAGKARARLISYIELGSFQEEYNGKPKTVEKVYLEFELSGPKHQPTKTEDGRLIPQTIGFSMTKSLSDKAKFPKLFRSMNYDGKAKHMAQLLDKEFLVTVFHKEREANGKKVVYANLYDENNVYHVGSPLYEDPETGEKKRLAADPRISPLRLYVFASATKAQWDSIFIDGKTKDKTDDAGNVIEEGRSRNRFQLQIMTALNFKGSPAEEYAKGVSLDFGEAEKPERSEENKQASIEAKAGAGASEDPLAAIS